VKRFGSGAACAKTTPLLVIPKPGLARNLLVPGSKAADSSRNNAALRNDNRLGIFKLHHYWNVAARAGRPQAAGT